MKIFKPYLQALAAYKPPLEGRDPARFELLDFNERTIPVGEHIKQALIDYINSDRLQMYPSYGDICTQLAGYCGVQESQVMITNGSDHGIELIFRGLGGVGDQAIIPGPTFAIYSQVAKVEGMTIVAPEYTKAGGYPLAAVLAAITDNTKTIVAANPNNPCGTPISNEQIATLAEAAPQAGILVDECYFEYTRASAKELLDRYPNIFITRTFSKTWGLPSLRFGYILTAAENIEVLLAMRGPYDINQLAVVAAKAALANPEYVERYIDEVMGSSKPAVEAFLDKLGIDYWPTVANYVLMFPADPDGLYETLMQAGILVRPRVDNQGRKGLRVTFGTRAQTDKLLAVMTEYFH
ncbi:histidinol-phosphate transaminase [Halioxenophilus sp. WMMB6]|uniref:pyridoxal phosphate-dependent aminotransferase n=1 Tax=Halioxenophilus sp. WMMB6 TaxID=3073815 RepID=UPI00295E6525|nr:histidinol-phosphate transaminase [Halioxenophilus sp. WMMB6]